jgi:aminoglycoside phosphotransferase (APT) family kinase protein
MASQLRAATGLPERDRVRLEECWSELRSQWSRSRWPSESGVVVHGDAHTLNTLVHDSQVYLLDLEDVKLGPWQWDVISPLVYMRAGWITTADYQAAIDAYGRDPLAEGDIDVLVSIRLLRMTCWLASRTGREPVLVEKVLRRIACLEDPTLLERRPSEF